MTHRDRIIHALNFKETDRVPVDLGGSVNTSMVVEAYDNFKKYLGIDKKNVVLQHPTRVVHVDEEVLQQFDIDTRTVTMWAPRNADSDFFDISEYTDMWGVKRRLRRDSLYFETVYSPLDGELTQDKIRRHSWPDPDDAIHTAALEEQIEWIRENTDCAIILYVPPPIIHISQYLRGMENWFMDLALNPQTMEYLLDTILDITLAMARKVLSEVGSMADVVTCSDDIGGQNGLLISSEHYQRFIRPRHSRYFDEIHSLTDAKLLYHSCGGISSIFPDLIEMGVNAVNPVQVSAENMDPANLKKQYGKSLAFWGGIDSSRLLPHGNVDEVKSNVLRTIEVLGEGGGYILSAVHNIQPDVPPENIEMMLNTALRRF